MYKPVDNQAGPKFCASCGNPLRPNVKFCASCGTAVAQTSTPPPPPPPAYPSYSQEGTSDPTQLFPPGQNLYTPPQFPVQPPAPYSPQKPQAIPFSNATSRVNLSLAMQYPFASSNWLVTMFIGGVMVFIPIIGIIFVNGYIVEIIRRVADDDYDMLPGWDDFGTKFKDGLSMMGLLFIWAFLPLLLLVAPGYALLSTGMVSEDVGLALTAIGSFLGVFATYFFLPIVWGRYAVTEQFSAGLQVAAIWAQVQSRFARYIGNWLLAGLMLFVGLTVITIFGALSITLMAICIGVFIAPFALAFSFYTTLMQAHLMGQLYRIMM